MTNSQPILKVKDKIAAFLSPFAIETVLVGAIIFFSSTQLGWHLWPSSAFIYGVRVDYLSPTLYFLDLLVILYLAITYKFHRPLVIGDWPVAILSPLLLANLLFSINPFATITWSIRLIVYIGAISSFIKAISRQQMATVLTVTMAFQVVLGLVQTAIGHAVQGPLYWLGERAFNVGSPNIAKADFLSKVILRSYGTFSHPNIMAGWLVIASLIVVRLVGLQFPKRASSKSSEGLTFREVSNPKGRSDPMGTRVIWVSVILAALGILLAQSRSAAIALFGIIPLYILKSARLRVAYVIVVCVSLFLIPHSAFLPSRADLSVTERLTLQHVSFDIIRTYPIFGTGTNASISTYPTLAPSLRLLQPDHDSFTLLLSWFGLAGIIFFVSILKFVHRPLFIVHRLIPLLPLFLFDHYLLTSPQGLFILLLFVGIAGRAHSSLM